MNKMLKKELLLLAKGMGVKVNAKMNKAEIISLIEAKKAEVKVVAKETTVVKEDVVTEEATTEKEVANVQAPVKEEVAKVQSQNKCQKVKAMLEAGKPVYLAKGNDLVVRVTRLDKIMFKGYFPNNTKVESFSMRWSSLLTNEWVIVGGNRAKYIANNMKKKSYEKFKNENLNKNVSTKPYMEGAHRYMVNADPRSGEAVVIDRNNMTVHKCSYGKGYKNLVTKAGIDPKKAKALVDSGEFAKVMLGAIRK